ncbi:hypothetical protein E4631_24640 [Hymenobacter sp. UV11]|uniref:hypothetical protein n=1 Tax=Hymenobacter sp. UV11 TaxID=1849735 RepID=UPI001061907D|nr:hypothetical protein [Hymenobacter sp. UV11]TFZ62743.1 hypothetical protein E4631_24640 [Hymenobacter sp. UV11]
MYPARALSLYNGWDILIEKPDAWSAIQATLLEMQPYVLGRKKTPKLLTTLGDKKLEIGDLDNLWSSLFKPNSDWNDNEWLSRYFDYNNNWLRIVDRNANIKNKTISYLTATQSKASDLSQLIFITNPKNVREGIIDLSILLVPENGFFNLFGSRDDLMYQFPFNESQCRTKIQSLSPIPYGAPFVILFFSQYEQHTPIQVEEVPLLIEDRRNIIERSLEFAPEYTQAGISVLSYFSEVLRQKYPDLNVKVRIEQQGTTVLMHVELPSGNIDTIREELANYFLVVAGKQAPESLLDNPYQIMALKTKLDMANMELRISRELNAHLSSDISVLREQFAEQGKQMKQQMKLMTKIVIKQVSSSERLQLAQLNQASGLFKDLILQAQGNEKVILAISSLEYNIMSGIAAADQVEVTNALSTLRQEKPSIIWQMVELAKNAGYGVAGNIAFELLKQSL